MCAGPWSRSLPLPLLHPPPSERRLARRRRSETSAERVSCERSVLPTAGRVGTLWRWEDDLPGKAGFREPARTGTGTAQTLWWGHAAIRVGGAGGGEHTSPSPASVAALRGRPRASPGHRGPGSGCRQQGPFPSPELEPGLGADGRWRKAILCPLGPAGEVSGINSCSPGLSAGFLLSDECPLDRNVFAGGSRAPLLRDSSPQRVWKWGLAPGSDLAKILGKNLSGLLRSCNNPSTNQLRPGVGCVYD